MTPHPEVPTMPGWKQLPPFFSCAFLLISCAPLRAQGVHVPGDPCRPVSQRTQEVGCWILADDPVGRFSNSEVFWHLDAYPTRAQALADKGPQGIVLQSMGRTWLTTIEPANWKPAHGTRWSTIGRQRASAKSPGERDSRWKRSYSLLRARIGSTDAARRAGKKMATAETSRIMPALSK